MSINLQPLTSRRVERDATGREVPIYRRREFILSKAQVEELKKQEELKKCQDPDGMRKWDGIANFPSHT